LQDLELDKARHLFDLHHDHVEQVGRAQDMGHAHGKDIADRQKAAQGLEPRRHADAACQGKAAKAARRHQQRPRPALPRRAQRHR
jgi:hypothetical protein